MREAAKEWLKFALDDLELAPEAARIGKYNLAAYHLEQAVEKSLKGVIVFLGKRHSLRTHDIALLIRIIQNEGIDVPEYVVNSKNFTDYAFTTRYPDDYVPVSREEYEEAYEIALKVYEWAKGIIEGSALE